MTGSLRGTWMNWVWFTMSARPSVILKKNRSVETLWLRVGTPEPLAAKARGIGRAAEESGEVLDPLHVVMLGLRCELADRHVFDHALPQRAYGLVGHGGFSCLHGRCEPLISRQDAPSRYRARCVVRRGALPPERFSPLVHF